MYELTLWGSHTANNMKYKKGRMVHFERQDYRRITGQSGIRNRGQRQRA